MTTSKEFISNSLPMKMPYTSKPSTNPSGVTSTQLSSTVWIGNIGNDLGEQEVLDFASSAGKIIKFDFMYHDGKEANVPRGYAFATYCDYSVANMALKNLNGKFLKGRRISVQPSSKNYHPKIDFRKKGSGSKESLKGLSLANSASSSEVSKEDKIRAIEAKLKALQNGEDTFHVSEGKSNSNQTNRASASSSKNLHNINIKSSAKSSSNEYSVNTPNSKQNNSHRHKPYTKYNSLNKR